MATTSGIDPLILKIHSTVLEPSLWSEVLGDLALMLKADSAMLFSVPAAGSGSFWHVLHNVDQELVKAYAASFAPHDEWLIGAMREGRFATGIVSVGEELLERAQFLRSLYFNEFLIDYGLDRFVNVCLKGAPAPGKPPETSISFYREPRKEAFCIGQVQLLNILAPHLVLAMGNLRQAQALALQARVYANTLDQLTAPFYAIDARGYLTQANRAAEGELTAARWLTVENHQLKASRYLREQAAVNQALKALCHGRSSTLLLTDQSGQQAMLTTAPLAVTSEFALAANHHGNAVGVLWVVPCRSETSSVQLLARLFLLTPAETRLLRQLTNGAAVKVAAGQLGIASNTARAQLKSIFRKTGRRTQGELLALVQRMSLIQASHEGAS